MNHDDTSTQPEEEEELAAPFTFKLAVALTVLYLGWRLVEVLIWVWERLTG